MGMSSILHGQAMGVEHDHLCLGSFSRLQSHGIPLRLPRTSASIVFVIQPDYCIGIALRSIHCINLFHLVHGSRYTISMKIEDRGSLCEHEDDAYIAKLVLVRITTMTDPLKQRHTQSARINEVDLLFFLAAEPNLDHRIMRVALDALWDPHAPRKVALHGFDMASPSEGNSYDHLQSLLINLLLVKNMERFEPFIPPTQNFLGLDRDSRHSPSHLMPSRCHLPTGWCNHLPGHDKLVRRPHAGVSQERGSGAILYGDAVSYQASGLLLVDVLLALKGEDLQFGGLDLLLSQLVERRDLDRGEHSPEKLPALPLTIPFSLFVLSE
ncbi:hypothetical protein VNO77_27080 [Canavalia gladiata]|uniref:Uncharacterized protein n=1 Tax=Canavalia gladiata TaxID=3824 RepID=A0AAN9Q656_CANGL